MKKLLTLLIILISLAGNSQVTIHFDAFIDIVQEYADIEKILTKTDLNGKPKSMSLSFSNIREQSQMDMPLGYNYSVDFDIKGYPKYYFIAQAKQEKAVEEKLRSEIFFDEKGILRKVIDGERQAMDVYDEKGNIIETVGVSSYYDTFDKKITDSTFSITKYKYQNNQILEKTQYMPTTNRDSLKEFMTTKNKFDARGNIIEQIGTSGKSQYSFGTIPSHSKYDQNNNLIEKVTADVTKKLKYDANNNLIAVTMTKPSGYVTQITYKDKKIISKRFIRKQGRHYDIDYTYTLDKMKNWTNANLKFTFYDDRDITKKRIVYLDIIRQINYYE